MKKLLVLFIVFAGIVTAQNPPALNPQDQKPDSTLGKWMPSIVTGLNISQIAYKDWAKGGNDALTWTITGDFSLKRKTDILLFSTRLKAIYTRTKISDGQLQTADNEIYWEIVGALRLGWGVDPFFSNTVRTPITAGFNYKVTPEVQIVDFFDPGVVVQSIGFTFDKMKIVKTRLGIAAQETFTNLYPQWSKGKNFLFESGVEAVTDMDLKLDQNLEWKSTLRLFTRFESLDVWDIRFDNAVIAKVNSWLNVNFSYIVLYEKLYSPWTQTSEGLRIGIVYVII